MSGLNHRNDEKSRQDMDMSWRLLHILMTFIH